jgi:alanyl-tRNA synthetase
MTAQEIRRKYIEFLQKRGHIQIPRALLVPQNDPTTLFTGSGMQPLIPYLLGEPHPAGTRLVDSQTCIRAQDIEEVGDNRHTTFFEMLGNWSLGDYFKLDQINWFWEFITKEVGLEPERIYVTCFSGDREAGIPKDTESAEVWKVIFANAGIEAKEIEIGTEENGYKVGDQGGRIFYYGEKNWWCRAGKAKDMPAGEPGGPDTEMFYLYPDVQHDPKWGEKCHVNCDCGRYIELGNSVFMEYIKTESGFDKLPKQNVDYGGGLERIAAAALDTPDVFRISLLWPIIEALQEISGKAYDQHQNSMRVIADHMRGAVFLAVDGVVPSNKEQGYVMRRLMRRAIRFAFELGAEQNLCQKLVPVIIDLYANDFPEVSERREAVMEILAREERIFRETLRKGLHEFTKLTTHGLTGKELFMLHDTYGFPVELSLEEAYKQGVELEDNWQKTFDEHMAEQRARSQTASKGVFKGGLADHSVETTKLHTATHLMYEGLRQVLGSHVVQRGSNVTAERTRFDFSHPEKVTRDQLDEVERIVNEQIDKDLAVEWKEFPTDEAFKLGAKGAFGDKYGDTVKVYIMGKDGEKPFSVEICGGPHVEHTGVLGENGKRFKITKEEASSAGVRRVKAVLQ